MSVQSDDQLVQHGELPKSDQQRIAALEEEVADLQTQVRELEEHQRDAASQEAFILKTIVKDIQTRGPASDLVSEITRHVRER